LAGIAPDPSLFLFPWSCERNAPISRIDRVLIPAHKRLLKLARIDVRRTDQTEICNWDARRPQG